MIPMEDPDFDIDDAIDKFGLYFLYFVIGIILIALLIGICYG